MQKIVRNLHSTFFLVLSVSVFGQQTKDSLVGVVLDEVVLLEDSLLSVEIEKDGAKVIFNPKEYAPFEIDSIRESIRWQKMGLNKFGIKTNALNLIDAIQRRIGGAQRVNPATGFIQLRSSNSLNNSKTIPLFIVDGQIYEIPDQAVLDAQDRGIPLWSFYPPVPFDDIVDVEVLNSLAETVRYGLQGNAGVIKITTKNYKKRKQIKSRLVKKDSSKPNPETPIFLENTEVVAPVFPGCEKAQDSKNCFKESVKEYVESKLAFPEGYSTKIGVRVLLQIYIDAFGNLTDYRARTTEGMEVFAKQAIKVLKTLPKMQPATRMDERVGVPFSFMVEFKKRKK